MNADEFIAAALRKIRVAKRGFSVSAEDSENGLEALNAMLGNWSAQELMVPAVTRETLALTAGTNPHTIGAGGTLNTAQPTDIIAATIRDSDIDFPVRPYSVERYQWEDDKLATGRPENLYFSRGASLGSIFFDLVPDANYVFILDSMKPLSRITDKTAEYSIGEEYEEAIIYNLAMRLAPEYGKEPSQAVVMIAENALRTIKTNNLGMRVPTLAVDRALLGPSPFNFNEIS